MDWTMEFTAAAQQTLADSGAEIFPGTDYRQSRQTPAINIGERTNFLLEILILEVILVQKTTKSRGNL